MADTNTSVLKKLTELDARCVEIDQQISDPEIAGDASKLIPLTKEQGKLMPLVSRFREYCDVTSQLEDAQVMLDDPEMKELAAAEIESLTGQQATLLEEIKNTLVMADDAAIDSVIMEIRPGTGGDEASLFAGDLYEMYKRYADKQGWKVETMDFAGTEMGGIREVTLNIKGPGVWAHLGYEGGGHRVQRVPETESQGRVHTSAATVAVLPEPEDVDVEINPDDIVENVSCAGGPGGQNVNKVASAIRLEHIPTGIVVSMRDERSQHKNRSKAYRILKSRLYEHYQQQAHAERSNARKSMIGSGDRSQRIRTYNFPQNRVTDHRINLSLYSLDKVMMGELDELIVGMQDYDKQQRLEKSLIEGNPMIIVVTGMVGIDKKAYLAEVCEYAAKRGQSTLLCNVGDMMYAEAPDIAVGRILDISLQRLHSLRRSVIKDIITKSKENKHIIVNTHATFRWRHGLFPAFDFYQMRLLNPDLFICMIDGVEPLHYRLSQKHQMRHTLKDLIVWREEEALATQMMQQGTNEDARCYILARGFETGTIETFYRLAFEPTRQKAYLSFPMTHVAGMSEVLAEIKAFRDSMQTLLTCFDPGDLEEAYLPYYAQQARKTGTDTIDVEVLGEKVQLDTAEVAQIEPDINSQIYARDFALIDQADMIISFIPELDDGMPALSSGVERELQHAHEAAKQVYVIWMPKKEPSVFVTQTANKIFRSPAEALKYFEKQYEYKSPMLFD